jgi:hypothetical protein
MPAAALQAMAGAPTKKRVQVEAAFSAALNDALHLLGALQGCITLLSGEWEYLLGGKADGDGTSSTGIVVNLGRTRCFPDSGFFHPVRRLRGDSHNGSPPPCHACVHFCSMYSLLREPGRHHSLWGR